MKIVIKNPAPADETQLRWGDYHFGLALQAALERTGHVVTQQFHDDWPTPEPADLCVVLRGLKRYQPAPGETALLWIISHPQLVSREECRQFQFIASASKLHARMLAQELGVTVEYLPQCTDPERFHAPAVPIDEQARQRSGLVYVANSRGVIRDIAQWAEQSSTAIDIIGRGWEHSGVADQVRYEYIDNARLGDCYRSAAAVLNDHWLDMKLYGYVSNRVLDALACHVPVISDDSPALREIFGDAVLCAGNAEEFRHAVAQCRQRLPERLESAAAFWQAHGDQFTFEQRANDLAALAGGRLLSWRSAPPASGIAALGDWIGTGVAYGEQREAYYQQSLARHRKRIHRLQDSLDWERSKRKSLQEERDALTVRLAEQEAQYRSRIGALEERLSGQAAQHKKSVAALESRLAERSKRIGQLKGKVTWEEGTRRRLQQELETAQRDLDAAGSIRLSQLESRLGAERRRVDEQRQQLRLAMGHIERLERDILDLVHSRSWRLTTPLRLVGRQWRRLAGRSAAPYRLRPRPEPLPASGEDGVSVRNHRVGWLRRLGRRLPPGMKQPIKWTLARLGRDLSTTGPKVAPGSHPGSGLPDEPPLPTMRDDEVAYRTRALAQLERLERYCQGQPNALMRSGRAEPESLQLDGQPGYWQLQCVQLTEELLFLMRSKDGKRS